MNPIHSPARTLVAVLVSGTLAVGLLAYGGLDESPSADQAPATRAADHPMEPGMAMGQGEHAAHREAPAASAPATEGSLYVLDGTWTDQAGRELALEDLAGRPRVVAMVYTHCSYACPQIIAQMKKMEAAFAGAPAEERPGFVLVSIDPERDTPQRLARFAESSRLDADDWMLLNGSDGQILELSVLLGVQYRATGDGEFAHSNVLTVLDSRGAIVERVEGLSADVAPAVEALREAPG